MDWLEKIRAKPQEQRIKIIWVTALAVALIMAGAWVLIGNYHYEGTSGFSFITSLWKSAKQ